MIRIYIIVALLIALVGGGWWANSTSEKLDVANKKLIVAAADYKQLKTDSAITEKVLSERAESKARIITNTKEIIKYVPKMLPSNDRSCLTGGFRVLLDSASTGTVPEATSSVTAPAVGTQDAAESVIENYGICRDNADQLIKLQQWNIETYNAQKGITDVDKIR